MSDPTPYTPGFSFSGYQASNPSKPLPGPSIDNEFANVAASIDETVDALKDIRRADGKLQNGSVTTDSLSSEIVFAQTPPAQWEPGEAYTPPQIVAYGNSFYRCMVAHTSTTFSVDLAAGNWEEVIRMQDAIDAADAAEDAATAAAASAQDAVAAAEAIGLPGSAVALNYLRQKADLSGFEYRTPAQVRADIGAADVASGKMIGEVFYWPAVTLPARSLNMDGTAISRTTYAALFAVLGTTYGAGDGSTTFNLPEVRGEFIRALDMSRGVDAARAIGSAQASQNLAHTHTGTTASSGAHSHTVAKGGSGGGDSAQNAPASGGTIATSSAGAHTHTFTTASSGGTEARPRNIAFQALIYAGV